MLRHIGRAVVFVMPLLASGWALGQEVRFYEENGVTYRETRHVNRRQVPETQVQQQQQTILRGQWRTEHQDVVRTYQVPVTEYRWETYWHGRYNPFVQPYLAHHLVPRTRWETRTEVAKVPTTRYETVPETTTVPVPVTTWRTVEDHLTQRVAVATRPVGAPVVGSSAPQMAGSSSIGGVQRMEGDYPRGGEQARKPGSSTALAR